MATVTCVGAGVADGRRYVGQAKDIGRRRSKPGAVGDGWLVVLYTINKDDVRCALSDARSSSDVDDTLGGLLMFHEQLVISLLGMFKEDTWAEHLDDAEDGGGC